MWVDTGSSVFTPLSLTLPGCDGNSIFTSKPELYVAIIIIILHLRPLKKQLLEAEPNAERQGLQLFLFVRLSPSWRDGFWQAAVLNSLSPTANGHTDRSLQLFRLERMEAGGRSPVCTGCYLSAGLLPKPIYITASVSRSWGPKVTQTSGPSTLSFKVCGWVASLYSHCPRTHLMTAELNLKAPQTCS